jgi:hypothetical protein
MRPLTFKGFLNTYVAYLSGEDTLDPARLASLVRKRPRLSAPLVLWAVETDRVERLAELLTDRPSLVAELRTAERLRVDGRLERSLGSSRSPLRSEYAKAWHSYVARRDAPQRDAELKLVARERALALEAQKHVSRYRLAKDLGLNPGNLHAFLTQGDPAKLSLEKAAALVKYLEAA